MTINITNALVSLRPTSNWICRGDNYAEIEWFDEATTIPTEQEVQSEIVRLQADYDAKEYQRKRVVAYPSIADQLDKIFHEGIDAWKAQIQAVKDAYPK